MRFPALLILVFLSFTAVAQQPSRSDLEKQRQKLLQSIKETQDQLTATKKDQRATLSQLRGLQAKLNARQKLIDNINQELGKIDNSISNSSREVGRLQQTLETQRMRYAQSVRYAYQNRNSYNTLVFIFSSSSYNEALRRMKYLKRYRDYRREQVSQMLQTQTALELKINSLNEQKSEKNDLLSAEEKHRQELQKETSETNAVVSELKGREKELSKEIERSRRSAQEVDRQIDRIIRQEIELARKKAEEEERRKREEEEKKRAAAAAAAARQAAGSDPDQFGNVRLNTGSGTSASSRTPSTPATAPAKPAAETPRPAASAPATAAPATPRPVRETPSYKLSLTPEVAALSNSFEANKGKLPWPVEKGFISLGFGPYQHPTEPRIMLDNAGISINTGANAAVRSVFAGTVSSTFFVSGAGWTVVLSHGQYYTVYSGLSAASVQKGQSVTIKQQVGTAGENNEGVPVINFQVWHVNSSNKTAKIDPAQWIAR